MKNAKHRKTQKHEEAAGAVERGNVRRWPDSGRKGERGGDMCEECACAIALLVKGKKVAIYLSCVKTSLNPFRTGTFVFTT